MVFQILNSQLSILNSFFGCSNCQLSIINCQFFFGCFILNSQLSILNSFLAVPIVNYQLSIFFWLFHSQFSTLNSQFLFGCSNCQLSIINCQLLPFTILKYLSTCSKYSYTLSLSKCIIKS